MEMEMEELILSPPQRVSTSLYKCVKALTELEDWISKLPEDILVLILSRLTMKEAARTSILSRRWRYLWTFSTGSLDFDCLQRVYEMMMFELIKPIEVERRRFIDWVNRVLKAHQGSTINEFRVCFDLTGENSNHHIDSWINFALEKRVKRLELDFTCCKGYFICGTYSLKTQFLHNYCLDSLTALYLNCVDVTGEVLEYILSNSPFLEVLSVTSSKSLFKFKAPGPLVKLKYFEVGAVLSLECMEISGVNLVSFKYCGRNISMSFKDVPNLVEAYFGGGFACALVSNVFQFSSFLSQIEMLVLDLTYETFERFPRFPKSRNLKQLELILDVSDIDSLLQCTSLLKAYPMLHKFTLKITELEADRHGRVKMPKLKRPHQCLKVVEIVGFVGCTIDIEFALYVLNNVVSLEKIIIDPSPPLVDAIWWESVDPDVLLATRNRAKLLETALPPGVELVIL